MSSPVRLLLAALMLVLAGLQPAAAQDPVSGFFRALFGDPSRPAGGVGPQGGVLPPGQTVQKPRPAEPKVVEQPKDANAQVVAVIGDWQTANLALGLQAAFADTPGIVVSKRIKSGMSLVRDGEFDLFGQIQSVLTEGRTDIIVLQLGINDRATFLGPQGQKLDDLRSEKWEAMYRERAIKLAKVLHDTGKQVFWVGSAPVERPQLNAFLDFVNGLHKSVAESSGITFIEVWNGFTDDEGNYAVFGADVDGREKRLRADDGISFTRTGQRKLAYFVEQEIRNLVRDGPIAETLAPEAPAAPQVKEEAMLAAPPPLPPAPWKRVWTPVSLGDQPQIVETDLAGAPAVVARPGQGPVTPVRRSPDALPGGFPVSETPYARRVLRGEDIEQASGRVDDFHYDRAQRRTDG